MALFGRKKKEPEPKPKSYDTEVSGEEPKYFEKDHTDAVQFKRMYKQGGAVAEAIDTYPLFLFANGWVLEGEDQALVDMVYEKLDELDFENAGFDGVIDALVCGFGIQEKVPSKDNKEVARLLPRNAENWIPKKDKFGDIEGFEQKIMKDGRVIDTIPIEKERVVYIDLKLHLIRRAYDDIMRDATTADSSSKVLQSAGFPRHHIKVGTPGERPEDGLVNKVGQKFDNLKAGKNVTTVRDVEISTLDQVGITNINEYNNWATQRLSASLGTPEEIIGLGRGSTEATANVRLKAFKEKIKAIGKRLARIYNAQLIDDITKKPGSVRLKFLDPPEDENRKADYITKIAQAVPGDPYALMGPEKMQKYLDIEDTEEEGEEDEPLEDEPEEEAPEEMPPDAPPEEDEGEEDGE